MLIPSIDLMNGRVVQLVGGERLELDAGDPLPIAKRFSLLGEIAVVDLDAALGRGSNAAVIERLLPIARCRVGGGIRDVETARRWLDAGAAAVVLGTAARPELLERLPRARTIAALDAVDGDVVVDGWRTRTGQSVESQMERLRDCVGGFLVTFVEVEGRMAGTRMDRIESLRAAAGDVPITIAGGVTRAEEVAALDAWGIDAQVGMALYRGVLHPADALTACLKSDRADGLFPTVVADRAGVALGLVYSSAESVRQAFDARRGIYHSRTRGLWIKGERSGARQTLLRIDVDCDRDTLRFTVEQEGSGFCHRGTDTCWGSAAGLKALERTLVERANAGPPESYTRRLLADRPLLDAKLREEIGELLAAGDRARLIEEAADVVYFLTARLIADGATWYDLGDVLDRRARRVTRRGGDRKSGSAESTEPSISPGAR